MMVQERGVKNVDKPLVSVIIPVYNCDRYLEQAIRSVLDQHYRPLELIVVDDGSEDHSADIAQSFKEVRYLHQPNQGVAAARNTGIAGAHGEFLAFLDADDLWPPNKLSAQVLYMLEHPQTGYTLTSLVNFLEPGTDWPSWANNDPRSEGQNAYSPCTLLARKTVFDCIGNFDSRYKIGEDTEWFVRAKDAEIPFMILSDVVVQRRIHGANLCYEKSALRKHTLMEILKASVDRKRHKEKA